MLLFRRVNGRSPPQGRLPAVLPAWQSQSLPAQDSGLVHADLLLPWQNQSHLARDFGLVRATLLADQHAALPVGHGGLPDPHVAVRQSAPAPPLTASAASRRLPDRQSAGFALRRPD